MFLLPEEHQRTYRSIVFIWLLATHLVGLEKGVKWKSLSWIFHRKKERTVKQSDCVRSLLFDAEHRRFPCINVASKQAPYCSFSPYSTQWKFKLLNWIAAVQVRLRSHVSFSLLSVWVQSFVKKKQKKKSSVQFTPVYGSSIQWSVYSTDVLRLCEYGCMSRPSLRGKPQVLHCLKVMSLICLFE